MLCYMGGTHMVKHTKKTVKLQQNNIINCETQDNTDTIQCNQNTKETKKNRLL